MKIPPFCFFFLTLLLSTAASENPTNGSIIFTTLGRSDYAFDIYTLPTSTPPSKSNERRITDGKSINFNGHFPSPSSSILSLLSNQTLIQTSNPPSIHLVYITERNGISNIYYDAVFYDTSRSNRKRSAMEVQVEDRVQVPLLVGQHGKGRVSMKDKPSIVGESVIYVSTHEDSGVPRTSWAAVYSTQLSTGVTRRLTPYGVADFSPAVSPSGVLTAVASYGKRGWDGEVQELNTDVYIFLTSDGSNRIKVVEHGGWPSWADESTLYFHRRGDDGWWSVFRAIIPSHATGSVVVQRVTPTGLHVFTPAASPADKRFIAVATRRPDSEYRHIELFDVVSNEFIELTRPISPQTHHFNPFFSPDSNRIGYHKCRGNGNGRRKSSHLLLENLQSPLPDIPLFRIDGSFPSFSPDGNRIAYVRLPGVYIVNRDGSGRRELLSRTAFSTAWDPIRKGVIYTSIGPTFASESTKVDVISINFDDDDDQVGYKMLTTGGENNAFPSVSPDGKWVVFRSGRSGHKNLYIMDAVDGEKGGIHRLTDGPWSDTMCNWSPDGDWIAFASDRENPGGGGFELYMIHPNGTGLKKLVQSGLGGRTNHPWFSPDGKSIVFTSDYGAVSAEPISNPHHYQPYGDIYTIGIDGSGIQRLTHNSYEDGTPTWGPTFIKPVDVELSTGSHCSFEDCHWLKKTQKRVAPLVYTKPQCGL